MLLLSSADIFKNELFQKIFQEHCQSFKQFVSRSGLYSFDLFQIRTKVLSVLILFQTVCKGYQQMTKVKASSKLTARFELYCFFTVFFSSSCLLANSLILLSDDSRCLKRKYMYHYQPNIFFSNLYTLS